MIDKKGAKPRLSYEYIRGLAEGEGTFTFCKSGQRKIPAFTIKMHVRDKALLEMVRDSLGIKNRVYQYNHQKNDGFIRGPQAMLIVREIGNLKDVIIPLFAGKLAGNKGKQFDAWIEKMWEDQDVPRSYKLIYKIYKSGFYDKNPRFLS